MSELSKYLCLLLRHQPEKAELDMDEHGWVSVEQLKMALIVTAATSLIVNFWSR